MLKLVMAIDSPSIGTNGVEGTGLGRGREERVLTATPWDPGSF